MVIGGSRPASDVVITVEPVRDEMRTSTPGNRAAVANNGSGLRGWVMAEAAWIAAQFVKVALSVFVVRGVTKLFQSGAASQQAYVRAERLWEHGYRESGYRVESASAWRPPNGNSGARESYGPARGTTGGNGFDHGAGRATPQNPRYVTTISGFHLYAHDTVINPARQHWCCPLLYRTPCDSCSFLEYDRGGTPHCVAVLKLRTILDGVDAGEDFTEIRNWIRNS